MEIHTAPEGGGLSDSPLSRPEANFLHSLPRPAHPLVMSTSPCDEVRGSTYQALPASVLYILRFEGLAIAALTALLYARTGAHWWLFAALWLLPDLSLLGYLASPFWGARVYNSVHAYATPATLAICALALGVPSLIPVALIWGNHIAVDRLLGYGLKFQGGSGWTIRGRSVRPLEQGRNEYMGRPIVSNLLLSAAMLTEPLSR